MIQKLKTYKWIVVIIVCLVVLALILPRLLGGMSKGYQAVFLTNNQVYFGKVQSRGFNFITLSDIYYIQVTQDLQSQSATGSQAAGTQASINLVKLGSELHGPQNSMKINRDHILFIEDLKPDSQVVTAIENYNTTHR